MSIQYYYSVYQLRVQSELCIPTLEITPKSIDGPSHVTISFGTVCPEGLKLPIHKGFAYQANRTQFWLNIPSVARFLVSNGQSIIIDPSEGIDEDSLRAFLLSICLEVLLRQRQLLVLPGYALKRGEHGIAFLGGSGLGQAMLQGLFYKQKQFFLATHFFVLNQQGDILPGVPQLEFLPQVVSALKIETQTFKTLRPGHEKYIIPLDEQYHAQPLPLKVIYTLNIHQQSHIDFLPLEEADKIPYLHQLLTQSNLPLDVWYDEQVCLPNPSVFDPIQIVAIHLPKVGLKLQQLADSIEYDFVKRVNSYA